MAIATVSGWIQNSQAAWGACFKVITGLVLFHVALQQWQALPSFGGDGYRGSTSWHTSRRLCLAQCGLVSLLATLSLHVQIRGLVGTAGIVPYPPHAADRIRRFPPGETLLHWDRARKDPARWLVRCMNVLESRWWARGCIIDPRHSDDWWSRDGCGLVDAKLTQLCWMGEAAAVAVMLLSLGEGGLCTSGALCVAAESVLGALRVAALLAATWVYRILKVCSTVFTSLQWDSLLIEANMLALPLALPLLPNCWLPVLMLAPQLCAFKVMFGSGVVKRRSRCPRWAASTAMDLHYETQPLPHVGSWYFHKLPHWWHAQECWIAFIIQLPWTFLQWGPQMFRLLAFLGYGALMSAIMGTGNYGFFNLQVLGLGMSMLDDSLLPASLPEPCSPLPHKAAVALLPAVIACGLWTAAACGLALTQLPRLTGTVDPAKDSLAEKAFAVGQRAHASLHPLGIGHSYGPFAGMTTFRWELIFEVSRDGERWEQLELPYKPGCVNTRPAWMPVGHFARLDWRLWFVPLGMGRGRWDLPDWVEGFISQLLHGSEPVAALTLSRDAIVASPPKCVRVSVWDYHLSSCDPTVHGCSQVTLSSADRDAAYGCQPGWWDTPVPRGRQEAADVGGHVEATSKAPQTEWGRWWYRRLICRYGVYFLQHGQLQLIPENSKNKI